MLVKAYLAKNKRKEHLHTVTYAYHNTNAGYPAEDKPFCLCTLTKQELYLGQMIKAEYPLEKKDGSIHYQTTTTEYDATGNVIAQNDKIDADRDRKSTRLNSSHL